MTGTRGVNISGETDNFRETLGKPRESEGTQRNLLNLKETDDPVIIWPSPG